MVCILFVSCSKKKHKDQFSITMSGEHICISLTNLMNEVNKRVNANETLPENISNLGGISWLEGYVVDDKNSDIILYGKKLKLRPSYQLSDLLDNFKNVFENDVAPYCSLDPKPENILKLNQVLKSYIYANTEIDSKAVILSEAIGDQMIIVGGVPRNSNHAFVMIDADYHMKKVSQGLVKLNGITSTLDLMINNVNDSTTSDKSDPSKLSMSRFWFHIKKNDNKVYPNFWESDNIVSISECPVVLLTEKQIADEKGNLSDDKDENPIAKTFAEEMSNNFSKLTDSVEVYAELENLFRLNALLKAAKFRLQNSILTEKIRTLMYSLSYSSKNEMPESLPGLVNLKEYTERKQGEDFISTQKNLFMVCGGVGMEMRIKKESIVQKVELKKFQNRVVQLRPNKRAYIWKVN